MPQRIPLSYPRAVERFGPEPLPWWSMIRSAEGSVSPDPGEKGDVELAEDRAREAAEALVARSGGERTGVRVTGRAAPAKARRDSWPTYRAVTIEAAVDESVFDFDAVEVPDEVAAAASADLRQRLASASGRDAASGPASDVGAGADRERSDKHETKVPEIKFEKGGVQFYFVQKASKTDKLAQELEVGLKVEKKYPLQLTPWLYLEASFASSLLGKGMRTGHGTSRETLLGTVAGKLETKLTLNVGGKVPNGIAEAALYGGGTAFADLIGVTIGYDQATGAWSVGGLDAIVKAAMIVGVKAKVSVPKHYLPEGWKLDAGVQQEYKLGGDWEIIKIGYSTEDGMTLEEGKDVAELRAIVAEFGSAAERAYIELGRSMIDASIVPPRHVNEILRHAGRGDVDPAPWARSMGNK